MSIVIVYDSIFGNTAQVAKAIAEELEDAHRVRLVPVSEAGSLSFAGREIELLIVGSPTRGFRPTPAISEFCEGLPKEASGTAAAVFDTRIALETIHPTPLRWVVDAGGYAVDRIALMLGHKGVAVTGTHAGFYVTGTEGPLADGEIEKAKAWARGLLPKAAAA